MANIDLLKRIRDKVVADPDTLDMNDWFLVPVKGLDVGTLDFGLEEIPCGTTACIAGWATLLSGDRLQVLNEGFEEKHNSSTIYIPGFDPGGTHSPRSVQSVPDRATELLDLPRALARWLYVIDNEDVVWVLDQLIAGRNTMSDLPGLMAEEHYRVDARYMARHNHADPIPTAGVEETDDDQH